MKTRALAWMRCNSQQARLVVLVIGLVAFIAKVLIFRGTYGTQDIQTWTGFAKGVSQRGPVGIYGINFDKLNGTLYNHPPLMGYYLEVVNRLSQLGVPLRLTIRAISSAADVISGLLVFEILRRRTSLLRSTASGVGVAASPVLFLISGYHGNTDPLFMMLVLLGSFLIIDKRMALLGGVVLALAVGVKLVPIVVLPTITVFLVGKGRALLVRAAAGFGVTFAITWGPPLLHELDGLKRNVLGYAGIDDRPWGLVRFADGIGWSWASQFMIGPGRYFVVLFCALLPAVLTWRRRRLAMESVAMSLVAFLVLTPAFGVQYLAWAVAAAYLLDFWSATYYNVLGGLLLFNIYTYWNGGVPWSLMASGQLLPIQIVMAAVIWFVLVMVIIRSTHRAIDEYRSAHVKGQNGLVTVTSGS